MLFLRIIPLILAVALNSSVALSQAIELAGRAAPSARRLRHRKIDHAVRQAPTSLHRDRGHARAARPSRREDRRHLLHRLCREGRRPRDAPGHLRFQRRAGRRVRVSASRSCGPAHRRVRPARQRRRGGEAHRQPGHLARLYRPRLHRPAHHRLEPHHQAGGGQRFLQRAPRRRDARQGDRALCRQQQPHGVAEIPARRKLRRLPRRQGGARHADRAGPARDRHRDGVADARHRAAMGGRLERARRRAALSVARRGRARPDQELQRRRNGRDRALRAPRLPPRAGRPAAARANAPRSSTARSRE